MKRILNTKTFFLCLLVSLGMATSCDDDEKGSKEVQLLSMGPSGVLHGQEISFIGENLDQVTSIVFNPALEIPRANFTSQSEGKITVTVPAAAERGKVILKTPSGDISSKSILDFQVPVVISSFTEEAKPGTNITITGTMLNWVESVTFPADLVVGKEDFVSRSQTELVIQVPMEAQTGFLGFVTSGTEPLSFATEEPLIVTLPIVSSLAPASVKHASVLTINGSALDLVTEITFSNGIVVPATGFESQTESKIEVVVPTTTVNGKLQLKVASGRVVETEAVTIVLPNVTSFDPAEAELHVEGATFTLYGTDLDLVKSISFPGAAAPVTTFTNASPTQITVTLPAGVQGGSVQLKTIYDFVVPVSVPFGNQLQLVKKFWDDAAGSGFGEWGGYGGTTTTWGTTEQARLGTKAIKVTYPVDSWKGGAQLGGGSVSTDGTANFAFSVYGGPGTEGKKIQVLIKTDAGDKTKQVTMKEGAWVDASIPLSEWGNPTTMTELFFQNVDFGGTIYIDHIGLK